MHPWEWPQRPWSRLHLDYAGPLMNKMFLVTVDAYTKWLEVYAVENATSETTIRKLNQTFTTHGLLETIVTDNGTVFTSREFQDFSVQNGIRHVTTAPYHPASNGLAERAVQTFKSGLKKISTGTLEERLSSFLFQYRITPHTTTGISPAELLMGRRPRSHLDLLKPDISSRIRSKQEKQKSCHDRGTKPRNFKEGDAVFIRNFGQGHRWVAGHIKKAEGLCSYKIQLPDGRIMRRHTDHIRERSVSCQPDTQQTDNFDHDDPLMDSGFSAFTEPIPSGTQPQLPDVPILRRSQRNRQPPERYGTD